MIWHGYFASPFVEGINPKNRNPLIDAAPLIFLASAESDVYVSPSNWKPASSTRTSSFLPLYSFVIVAPGAGSRGSRSPFLAAGAFRSALTGFFPLFPLSGAGP